MHCCLRCWSRCQVVRIPEVPLAVRVPLLERSCAKVVAFYGLCLSPLSPHPLILLQGACFLERNMISTLNHTVPLVLPPLLFPQDASTQFTTSFGRLFLLFGGWGGLKENAIFPFKKLVCFLEQLWLSHTSWIKAFVSVLFGDNWIWRRYWRGSSKIISTKNTYILLLNKRSSQSSVDEPSIDVINSVNQSIGITGADVSCSRQFHLLL